MVNSVRRDEMDERTWDLILYADTRLSVFDFSSYPAIIYCSLLISSPSLQEMNSRSVFPECRYAIAHFLSQNLHLSDSGGWIINTISLLGLVGLRPSAAAYCAFKGACGPSYSLLQNRRREVPGLGRFFFFLARGVVYFRILL